MLTLNSIVQRNPDVVAASAGEDLIMVSIATGYYYGVSDVAQEIWGAIEHPKKVADLVGQLTESYQIEFSSCKEETLAFLEALRAENLLQVKNEPIR